MRMKYEPLTIDEAATVPPRALRSSAEEHLSPSSLLFSCLSTARCGTACAQEHSREEQAGYGSPHETEVVFPEGGGHAVRQKGVATLDVSRAALDRRDQLLAVKMVIG